MHERRSTAAGALAAEGEDDDRLDLALLDQLEQLDDVGAQVAPAAALAVRVALAPPASAATAAPAPASPPPAASCEAMRMESWTCTYPSTGAL